MASTSQRTTISLYRRILRLHRQLPSELRYMGDGYVKDEWRRHVTAAPEHVAPFMQEWKNYADFLEQQQRAKASQFGKPIDPNIVDELSSDQQARLGELAMEATRTHEAPPVDPDMPIPRKALRTKKKETV